MGTGDTVHTPGGGSSTTWELNTEGYRLIADLLLGMRRITARAVQRISASGKGGGGWPDPVREVLIEHQMLERELPRHAAVDDDLMAFATFSDLAARIRAEDELCRLVDRLGSKPGEILNRLDQLESIRRDVAEARPLDVTTLDVLRGHHDEIGRILAGARRGSGSGSVSGRDRGAEPGGGARAHDASGVGESREASRGTTRAAAKATPEAPPDDVSEAGAAAVELEPAIDEGAIRESIQIEHDAAVLAAIHAEVTAIAEDVFAGRRDRPAPGWDAILDTGWYDSRRDSRGLDPLAAFYDTVRAWADAAAGGADPDGLRALLRDRGFSGLLLSLRDMFDRNRL